MRNIVGASYMGRQFMVIEGTERHNLIRLADTAAREGRHNDAQAHLKQATVAFGCPFEARENWSIQRQNPAQWAKDCADYAIACENSN
jgi:hypothetical protein